MLPHISAAFANGEFAYTCINTLVSFTMSFAPSPERPLPHICLFAGRNICFRRFGMPTFVSTFSTVSRTSSGEPRPRRMSLPAVPLLLPPIFGYSSFSPPDSRSKNGISNFLGIELFLSTTASVCTWRCGKTYFFDSLQSTPFLFVDR